MHVFERLLGLNDGLMLEALKKLAGGTIHLPGRERDYPDRDRRATRYGQYKAMM